MGTWESSTPLSKGSCCYMAPDRQLLPYGSTSSCGQTSDCAREARYLYLLFSCNLLSFNSIFRKYCVCRTKCICELGVDCGLWLSAFVLNHCTCWRECQRQKTNNNNKNHVSTFVCSCLEGALPSNGRLGMRVG